MGMKNKARREENKERMNKTPRRHQNSSQYMYYAIEKILMIEFQRHLRSISVEVGVNHTCHQKTMSVIHMLACELHLLANFLLLF